MTNQVKQQIVDVLKGMVELGESQAKLAVRAEVKASMMSDMLSGKWSLINDGQFRKVQTNLHIELDWKTTTDTSNFKKAIDLLKAVKRQRLTLCVADNAGKGKSEAYKHFKKTNKNVLYIECKKVWTKKGFLKNMLRQAGIEPKGTSESMYEVLVNFLKMQAEFTIIIDQMDKLCDPSFDIFMDLYNDLRIYVSFLLSGTKRLKNRIKSGVQREKEGYDEIYSRIGKTFITFDPIKRNDVKKICLANGLDDEETISEIFNTCEQDLRVVRTKVEKYFLLGGERKAA